MSGILKDDLSDPVVLERRKPVWHAISDLCLDTDIDVFIVSIAKTIRTQGYTAEEARKIAFYEVFPVTYVNLCTVAGEWAGFDEAWLFDKIISNRSRISSRFGAYLKQPRLHHLLDDDWKKVEKLLA
jgi:hypothetical protein